MDTRALARWAWDRFKHDARSTRVTDAERDEFGVEIENGDAVIYSHLTYRTVARYPVWEYLDDE